MDATFLFKKICNVKTIFILSLIYGLVIRIFRLFYPIWGEEGYYTYFAVNSVRSGQLNFLFHPPIGQLIYVLSAALFGPNNIGFRIVPFVFGLLTIYITYVFAKKMFGLKAAYISTSLLLISKIHIEATNLVDLDGAILTAFNLLSMYFVWLFFKRQNKKMLVPSGIFLVLSSLTKISGAIIAIPSLLFTLIKRGFSDFKLVSLLFIVGVISTFIGTLFVPNGLSYGVSRIQFDLFQRLRMLLLVSWHFTVPFVLLVILAIFEKSKDDNKLFLKLWIISVFLIFFLVVISGQPDRHLSVIVPPFFILLGSYLQGVNLKNKWTIIFGILTVLPLVLLQITDRVWNYSLTLTILPYLVPGLIFILANFKKYKFIFVSLLLFSGIAYNIYLTTFDQATILTTVSSQAINYYLENYHNQSVIANLIGICYNLEINFNNKCDLPRVNASVEDYNNSKIIILMNFYQTEQTRLKNQKYPVSDEVVQVINNSFTLVKEFKFLNKEYAWVFEHK